MNEERNQTHVLERWKNAAIHLEGVTDEQSRYERDRRVAEMGERINQGYVTPEDAQLLNQLNRGSTLTGAQGTAVFLSHEGKRYLLTARHVLHDTISGSHEVEEAQRRAQEAQTEGDADHANSLVRSAQENAENQIFRIIRHVPSLVEVLRGPLEERAFLRFAPKGLDTPDLVTPGTETYTFSDQQHDLAIISLDQQDEGSEHSFANELEALGYQPVTLSDISDGPSAEGAEVFTVGYPGATSLVGEIPRTPKEALVASRAISLPNFSWGKVSMLHEELIYFWCDMSVYPGNSGGPVIENDKLVGIVSKQAILPVMSSEGEFLSDFITRIPFGNIVKAEFVRPLLDAQAQKDELARSV